MRLAGSDEPDDRSITAIVPTEQEAIDLQQGDTRPILSI